MLLLLIQRFFNFLHDVSVQFFIHSATANTIFLIYETVINTIPYHLLLFFVGVLLVCSSMGLNGMVGHSSRDDR